MTHYNHSKVLLMPPGVRHKLPGVAPFSLRTPVVTAEAPTGTENVPNDHVQQAIQAIRLKFLSPPCYLSTV